MRTSLFSAIVLLGSCTIVTQNLVVERCNFDGIRCIDDQTQLECIDGIELPIECDSNLICVQGLGCSACGNNEIDAGEECDGNNLPANDCSDLANENFDNGRVVCNADCTLNLDECSLCGNDRVEGLEECDADSIGDGCDGSNCRLVFASCDQNGNEQGLEVCDGNDLGGQSCVSLGFARGTLQCEAVGNTCGFDISDCEQF